MLKEKGFTLIEVMISMALLGIAAVSLLSANAYSIYKNNYTNIKNIAYDEAQKIKEIIQSYPDVNPTLTNKVAQGNNTNCTAESNKCDAQDQLDLQIYQWNQRSKWVNLKLPNGFGVVCRDSTPTDGVNPWNGNAITYANAACDGNGSLVVKIFWTMPDMKSTWTPYSSSPKIYMEIVA